MTKEKRAYTIEYISVFFITFLISMLRLFKQIDINVSLDEIGTLASAAKLGGLDWENVVENTRYYGQGFYWIYAFLFRLTSNPYIIYLGIFVLNSMLTSIISVGIFCSLYSFDITQNRLRDIVISCVPALCYTHVNYNYISNDVPVFIFFWVLIFLIIKAFKCKNEKRAGAIYSILISIDMGLLLTFHEKTIAVWIGILICIFIYWVIYHEQVVNVYSLVIASVVSYALARWFKDYIINLFWTQAGKDIANANAFSEMSWWFVQDLKAIKIMFDVAVTNIIVFNQRTMGLFVLTVVIIVPLLFEKMKYTILKRSSDSEKEKLEFFLLLLSCVVVAIIIVGLIIDWGNGIYQNYDKDNIGKAIRAYSYVRYYVPFAGPALVITGCKIDIYERRIRHFILLGGICTIALYKYYLVFVHDQLVNVWGGTNLGIYTIWDEGNNNNIILSILITIGFYLILLLDKHKRKVFYYICMFFALVILNVNCSKFSFPQLTNATVNGGTELIHNLEKKDDDLEQIYVESNKSMYQFMNPTVKIKTNLLDENTENMIVLAEPPKAKKNKSFLTEKAEWSYGKLDDNEYVYVKGSYYVDVLSNMGYSLEKIK